MWWKVNGELGLELRSAETSWVSGIHTCVAILPITFVTYRPTHRVISLVSTILIYPSFYLYTYLCVHSSS